MTHFYAIRDQSGRYLSEYGTFVRDWWYAYKFAHFDTATECLGPGDVVVLFHVEETTV